ncbi:MAG: fasciclin domain-containing protein, partial [Candidatus Poseidoniaceae archaeon]
MRKSLVYTFVACLLLAAMPYSVVADATEDIPTNAAGTGVHESLVAALVQADLVTTLEGDGPFTVFAPTDQAFTDAGIDLAAFDTDEEIAALTDILLYHVISGTILSTDLAEGDNDVVAANGDKLTVTLNAGTVTVGADDATVTTADVVSSNGVIHVIDKVLTPPAGEICYNVITHTIVA